MELRIGIVDTTKELSVEVDGTADDVIKLVEKALSDAMLAFAMNGEALRPEQGYPLRAVIPGWEGNLWVKWLRRIEVGDQPWQTREET